VKSCVDNPIIRYDEPEHTLFVKLIEQSQGITLDPDLFSISEPEFTRDHYTRVVIAPTQYSPLSSQIQLYYRRINISLFFYGISIQFQHPDEITAEWLSHALLARWNILIEPDKLHLTVYQSVPRHPVNVVATIDSSSLVWTGEVDVWLIPEGVLGDVFEQTTTPLSFNIRQTRLNAYFYSHEKALLDLPVDLYTYLSGLDRLYTLDVESTQALAILTEKTGDPWTIDQTPCPFNLYNAQVCYAGVFWLPEHEHAHCVVFKLDRACTNLYGYFIVYCQMPTLQSVLTQTELGGFSLYLTEQTLPGFVL
jgi:hypothetical protein